jgi:hypothetical protein
MVIFIAPEEDTHASSDASRLFNPSLFLLAIGYSQLILYVYGAAKPTSLSSPITSWRLHAVAQN